MTVGLLKLCPAPKKAAGRGSRWCLLLDGTSPPLPTVSPGYTSETSSDLVSVLLMVGEIALSKMDLHSC